MSKYILRLDDACPTMNKKIWDKLEILFDKYNIKPIVAVIPENKDPSLMIDKQDTLFWNKAKEWEKKKWCIALHGYDHVYITNRKGIVPFHKRSEFSGLNLEEQRIKISKGIKVFYEKGIKPTAWVAPSHNFDLNTLKAIKAESDIKIVSDGIAFYPYTYDDMVWIPQQVWKFKKKLFGVWTICIHPNEMKNNDFHRLEKFVAKNHCNIVAVKDLNIKRRRKNQLDYLLEFKILLVFRTKTILKKLKLIFIRVLTS